jgi:addiction module HigA family antidote
VFALNGQKAMHMKSKSLTITKEKSASERRMPPVHPGEILLKEFLKPLGLSQYRLAKGLSVPARRINEIVLGVRSITADTALRLARFFGTSERFWLNLQSTYDLEVERDRLQDRLVQEVEVLKSA